MTITSCSIGPEWEIIHYPKAILYNFQLFDGVKNRLQTGKSILIEGDKIIGVENSLDLRQYKDYKHIDFNGWTLLPGFIDNHVHMTNPFIGGDNLKVLFEAKEQVKLNFKNCVMSGVTTVRDVGAFPDLIRKYQEKSDKNEIPGPRVFSSMSMIATREGRQLGWPVRAKYIENPIIKWKMGGNIVERPTSENEVKEICQEMISLGATWLKTLHHDQSLNFQAHKLPNHTDNEYRTILKIGKDTGIKCAMHAMLVSGFEKGVDLGYHTIEHTPMDEIIQEKDILKLIKNEGAIIPTIKVVGDFLAIRNFLDLIEMRGKEYLTSEALKQSGRFAQEVLAIDTGNSNIDVQKSMRGTHTYFKFMFPNIIKNVEKLMVAGAKIGVGTDSGGTPLALFGLYIDELKYLASAGIPNSEVLKMATAENAQILDLQDKIGTLEKGKLADLIAVQGNPLDDIDAIGKIKVVMKGGNFLKPKVSTA